MRKQGSCLFVLYRWHIATAICIYSFQLLKQMNNYQQQNWLRQESWLKRFSCTFYFFAALRARLNWPWLLWPSSSRKFLSSFLCIYKSTHRYFLLQSSPTISASIIKLQLWRRHKEEVKNVDVIFSRRLRCRGLVSCHGLLRNTMNIAYVWFWR